jgi:hypothetical protein
MNLSALMPAAFIIRAMRFLLQAKRASRRSRITRSEPYMPSLAARLCLDGLQCWLRFFAIVLAHK